MSSAYSEVSIIIPTHERSMFLRRALEWYKDIDCRIFIVDSSQQAFFDGKLPDNVLYLHEPGNSYLGKVRKAIALVETAYTLFIADDDFLVLSSLQPAIQFLQDFPQYSSIQGHHVGFIELQSDQPVDFKSIHCHADDLRADQEEPWLRIEALLSNYINNFYSLQRTSVWNQYLYLREKFKDVNRSRGPVYELLQAMNCVALGKHKMLDMPWIVREFIPNSSGGKEFDFKAMFAREDTFALFSAFAKELAYTYGVDKELFDNALKNGVDNFIALLQKIERKEVSFSRNNLPELFSQPQQKNEFNDLQLLVESHREVIVPQLLKEMGLQHYTDYLYGQGWWKKINQRVNVLLQEKPDRSYILYCAGEHSTNLMRYTELGKHIVAICDSNPEKLNTSILGIECQTLKSALQLTQHIIISSHRYEAEIFRSLSAELPDSVKIYTLYQNN